MAVKITVKNKAYSEKVHGIQFKNGEAFVEDDKLAISVASRLGYEYEKIKEEPKKEEPKKEEPKKEEPKKEEPKKEEPKKEKAKPKKAEPKSKK